MAFTKFKHRITSPCQTHKRLCKTHLQARLLPIQPYRSRKRIGRRIMTPPRPYLIRAFYDWIIDNNLTPYIVIDASAEGVVVPQEYVKDDKIVLNIAAHVVNGLALGNEVIQFKARFGGVPRSIYAPVAAVTAIYAKENGRG